MSCVITDFLSICCPSVQPHCCTPIHFLCSATLPACGRTVKICHVKVQSTMFVIFLRYRLHVLCAICDLGDLWYLQLEGRVNTSMRNAIMQIQNASDMRDDGVQQELDGFYKLVRRIKVGTVCCQSRHDDSTDSFLCFRTSKSGEILFGSLVANLRKTPVGHLLVQWGHHRKFNWGQVLVTTWVCSQPKF